MKIGMNSWIERRTVLPVSRAGPHFISTWNGHQIHVLHIVRKNLALNPPPNRVACEILSESDLLHASNLAIHFISVRSCSSKEIRGELNVPET